MIAFLFSAALVGGFVYLIWRNWDTPDFGRGSSGDDPLGGGGPETPDAPPPMGPSGSPPEIVPWVSVRAVAEQALLDLRETDEAPDEAPEKTPAWPTVSEHFF